MDLEQPAPVCHATVLALTLRNVTRRPKKSGGRPVYHAFELPFHAKYPAPVKLGEGCSSNSRVRFFGTGPVEAVSWAPPTLLLCSAPRPDNDNDGGGRDVPREVPPENKRASPRGAAPVAPEANAGAAKANAADDSRAAEAIPGQQRGSEGKGDDVVARSAGGGRGGAVGISPGQWSLLRVHLELPLVVAVPAGCMRDAELVSGVTLLVALLCSAAVVAASWW